MYFDDAYSIEQCLFAITTGAISSLARIYEKKDRSLWCWSSFGVGHCNTLERKEKRSAHFLVFYQSFIFLHAKNEYKKHEDTTSKDHSLDASIGRFTDTDSRRDEL